MAEAEVTAAAAVGVEELDGKVVPTAVVPTAEQKQQKLGAVRKFDEVYWSEVLKSAPPVSAPKAASEGDNLMQKVKDAGPAGIISYVFWEWAFWGVSIPVALFGFQAATGYWPDFSNQDDMAKLGAEAFAFVNVARFAVPLRIGLALGTTPWVKANIVDKVDLSFLKKDDEGASKEEKK